MIAYLLDPVRSVPPEMRAAVQRRKVLLDRAEGLPLFLEELARTATSGADSLPLRLHELLSARVRSAKVDLRVTQVVNGAAGVHAVLADTALT